MKAEVRILLTLSEFFILKEALLLNYVRAKVEYECAINNKKDEATIRWNKQQFDESKKSMIIKDLLDYGSKRIEFKDREIK